MSSEQQLVIFSEPRARHDDPPTAKAAAEKLKKNNRLHVGRVADIVDAAGYWGCIADEVWQVLRLEDGDYWQNRRSTVHGRVSNASTAGLIVPRGYKHVRLSVLDEPQTIYVTARHFKGETE